MNAVEPPLILIVEKPLAEGFSLRPALVELGMEGRLLMAGSVSGARRLAAERRPELVLADLDLPDGEAAQLLKGPRSIPSALVVMADRDEDLARGEAAVRAGALDYLVKRPMPPGDLRRMMARFQRLAGLVRRNSEMLDQLREREAFNFALFQNSPDPIVIVDREGRVVKSNLARRRHCEPLPDLGAPLYDPARGETERELASGLAATLATGCVKEYPEVRLGECDLAITMAPVPSGAVVISRDISAQVRARQEAEQHQQAMMQADRMMALGRLVSGVAHEVSNPNNVLLLNARALRRICADLLPYLDLSVREEGDCDLAGRPYAEVRPEIPGLVDAIVKASERIKHTVDDLKAFARNDSGSLKETVDVNAVVAAASDLMGGLIRKATTRFTVHPGAGLPPVMGNAQRLEQVVINLLTNACQALASPEDGIEVVTRHDAGRGRVVVEVRDEGVGIAPESMDKIFEIFYTTRRDAGGTGLGLSICRRIVDSHGGSLTLRPGDGKGTVAVIDLPALTAPGEGA